MPYLCNTKSKLQRAQQALKTENDMKDFEITIAIKTRSEYVYQVRTYSFEEAVEMAKDIIEETFDDIAYARIVKIIEL